MTYFECALTLLVIELYYGSCFEGNLFSMVLIAGSALLVLGSLNGTVYSHKEVRRILMFSMLSFGVYWYTKETLVLVPVILFLGMQKTDLKRLIKVYVIVNIVCTAGIVFLEKAGILKDVIVHRAMNNGEIIQRHSMGFSHPNELCLRGTVIILALLYLNESTSMKKRLAGSIIAGGILYYITGSRGGIVVLGITVILEILYKKIKYMIESYWLIQKIIENIFILLSLLSIVVAITFGRAGDTTINRLFSFRFYYWQKVIEESSALGIQDFMEFLIDAKLILDNTYIYVLGACGGILFILYAVLFRIAMKRLLQKKMIREIIFVCIFCGYGVVETLINPVKNFSLIFVLYALQKVNMWEETDCSGENINYCSNI